MLDLVKIEFLKQRHQKLNFVVYGVVSLYLALICYYVNDARGLFDSFPFVLFKLFDSPFVLCFLYNTGIWCRISLSHHEQLETRFSKSDEDILG